VSVPARELIPVTLLTGFLGSGKTTLLAKLLKKPGMAETAVIVNEFGEVGLDHLLVAKGEENVVLLDSGCLCCTVSNALNETLGDLHFRRVRGEIPPFKRAVIETTGLADPAPILHMLMTDYFVSAHYALDGIVTTVDGLHGERQLAAHAEAVKQAALADRIILTKGDLAGRETLGALRARLAALNRTAGLLEAVDGELDPAAILGAGLFDPAAKAPDVRRWLSEEALAGADHDHAHNRHDERIRNFCLTLERAASWQGYAAWLQAMRGLSGPDLLRVKGLLEIAGEARPYVIQGVEHVFSPPLRLEAWPAGEQHSRLVFITRGIARETIERTLSLLCEPTPAPRPSPPEGGEGGRDRAL
jgi:G3E family GTPase